MIKLDDNLLVELGLHTLPSEDKKNLLRHIYETLELRVGTTLAQQMTDGQLDEFESFINNNDESGALHWLETNFPNYKDVVAREFEVLKDEVRQAAPQILASAQQQPMYQPQPMPQQGPAPMGAYQYPQQPAPNMQTGMPPQYAQPTYQQPAAAYPQPMPQQQTPYPTAQQQPMYQPQPMPPQYTQPSQPQQPQPFAADDNGDDQTQYSQAA